MTVNEPSTRPRRLNPALTLADCAVLVLGAALAMSLPRIGAWGDVLPTTWQLCGKAGLSLLPLVLFRCFRLGRPIRPAELLLAVVAASRLVEAVDYTPWVLSSWMILYPNAWVPKEPDYLLVKPFGPYWWVRFGAWAVALACLILLARMRHRSPARARATLLVLFILGSYAWALDPANGLVAHRVFTVPGVSDVAICIARASVQAVTGLIPATVAASALLDAIARRGRLGATEWLGIMLSVVSGASVLAFDLDLLNWASMAEILAKAHLLALIFCGWIAAGLLGLLVAGLLGIPGAGSSLPPDAPGA